MRLKGEGMLLGDLMALPEAPADIRERLASMIDRGLIESPDPLSENARFTDDPAALGQVCAKVRTVGIE